jgi:hypothetical protein
MVYRFKSMYLKLDLVFLFNTFKLPLIGGYSRHYMLPSSGYNSCSFDATSNFTHKRILRVCHWAVYIAC